MDMALTQISNPGGLAFQNRDKPEQAIVTPVSGNSYMWPIRDTLDS